MSFENYIIKYPTIYNIKVIININHIKFEIFYFIVFNFIYIYISILNKYININYLI